MTDNTYESELLDLFGDTSTPEKRLEYRDSIAQQYYQESKVTDGTAKWTMCLALANSVLISQYLAEKLAMEGGLKGEPLRIYTGSQSTIARMCKALAIGIAIDGKAPVEVKDDF